MPSPTLTPVALRREAFRALLSALKELVLNDITVIIKALPKDPPDATTDRGAEWYAQRLLTPSEDCAHLVERLKHIPGFLQWAELSFYEWRVDDPTEHLNLTMLPVPVMPSMPLDRADLQRPILALPADFDETEEEFMACARAHYRARVEVVRAKGVPLTRVAARSQIFRDAVWYVERDILRRPSSLIFEREGIPENEVNKRIREFVCLLDAPARPVGRPAKTRSSVR